MNKTTDLLDTIEKTCLEDLEGELEEEFHKPSEERDLEKMRELIETISYIKGDDSVEHFSKQKEQINQRVKDERTIWITRRKKRLAAAAACAVVLFGLNQASLNAYGENVFSRVYHFTKGGISIMVGENNTVEPTKVTTESPTYLEEVIELPTTPDDPYGIRAVCAENGLYPMTPKYIPDGFKLVRMVVDDDQASTDIVFRYKKEKEMINLYYTYHKTDNQYSFGVPTESDSIQELTINNQVFTVIKESKQLKAFCINDNLLCNICTYDIDDSESYKILYSIS